MASIFLDPTRPQAVGTALTQPQMPAPGAPTDPSQVGLWQRFQQRLAQDPNLRMALLTTGLNLLKSPQPGQGGFDVFSNAALTGVGTLDQLRQRDLGNKRLDLEEGRRDTELGLAERRTTAAEAGVAETQVRTQQATAQFDAQMQLARDKLAEDKRQFDERAQAGAFGGYGDTTGQERILKSMEDALVTANPSIYPDTLEGHAKARLIVSGYDPSDRTAQARTTADLFRDLVTANQFLPDEAKLTTEEMRREALETYNLFLGSPLGDSGTANYDGMTTPSGYKVVSAGDGRYIFVRPDGQRSQPVARERVEEEMRKGGQ